LNFKTCSDDSLPGASAVTLSHIRINLPQFEFNCPMDEWMQNKIVSDNLPDCVLCFSKVEFYTLYSRGSHCIYKYFCSNKECKLWVSEFTREEWLKINK